MRFLKYSLALVLAVAAAGQLRVVAAPAPLLTFYGMLVDEFGWPYESKLNVTVSASGLVVLTKSLQPAAGRNYNFIFRIPYDTGVVEYSSSSVTAGDVLDITLSSADTGSVLIHKTLTVTTPPGTVININLSSAIDTVGDGLPDALRYWIWQSLNLPGPFDPTKITAGMDSDGDGVSNLNEFLAGTDPANAQDTLKLVITDVGLPNNGAVCTSISQLTWFSVPGKSYQIQEGQIGAQKTIWSPVYFAASPTGDVTNSFVLGTGNFISAFVPTCGINSTFRLSVYSPPAGAYLVP